MMSRGQDSKLITKESVAQLKAFVDGLEDEKRELEARIREAYAEFNAAEREYNRSEKPTPGMLKVLTLMADGAVLKARTFAPYGYFWANDNQSDTVRESVYFGLRSREAIEESQDNNDRIWTRCYRITEHGRQIVAAKPMARPRNDPKPRPKG